MFRQKENERKDQTVILYHGTTMSRAEVIVREGFLRKKTASRGIFFAQKPGTSRGYARSRAISENGIPVLIKCSIDLNQYNQHRRLPSGVYVFRHKCIGSETITEITDLRRGRGKKPVYLADARNRIPRITLDFNSGQAAIGYWMKNSFLLNGQDPGREDDTVAAGIKRWLIDQANAGRTGSVPENEIQKVMREYGGDT